ncbi:MAG: hypothetical protein ACM3U2_23280 [Deltaproteobacteria bacterium]
MPKLNQAQKLHLPTQTNTPNPSNGLNARSQTHGPERTLLPERAPVTNRAEVARQRDGQKNMNLPAHGDSAIHHSRLPEDKVSSEVRLGAQGATAHAGSLTGTAAIPHDAHRPRAEGRHLATATERLKAGHLERMVNAPIARHVDLKTQFQLHEHGDLARRLNLPNQLAHNGGWQHRLAGRISPLYTKHAFGHHYAGPGFYPHYCWFPRWSPWVNWCWNFVCRPYYDPRPIFCQPIVYAPCGAWTGWNYPVWAGLPVISCGTWVDVPIVSVPSGIDVQLLAVRFVDPGHPEQRMGPRYRVWFRNNSSVPVEQPFDLVVYASNDRLPGMGLPETGVRVTGMEAGQIQAVDLRLPWEANVLGRDPQGNKIPFRYLHLIVDSQRELPEMDETNNGAVLDRFDILPVDPAIFSAALDSAGGQIVDIAGEGFGPEAGQAVIELNGQELPLEILGWCDVGVQVRLPSLVFSEPTKAEIIIIRGDKAASNPHPVSVPPEGPAAVVPNPVP